MIYMMSHINSIQFISVEANEAKKAQTNSVTETETNMLKQRPSGPDLFF